MGTSHKSFAGALVFAALCFSAADFAYADEPTAFEPVKEGNRYIQSVV